jgi:glycosyltransferase involved in cell wall biosynthesis
VFDLFISTYDTLVFDRKLISAGSLAASLVWWLERLAIRSADLVLLDTETHARRVERLFGLPSGSCDAVLVGAETEHFHPTAALENTGPLRVLFYGQLIPLHGIETIIAAARLMRDEPVEWTVIGRGQEAPRIRRMLAEVPLPKLRWIEWVQYHDLRNRIAEADLTLGIFGTSEKAACVIPNKVFQALAMGRPLVTRDSTAIRELLAHRPPCVTLVPAADPDALAAAIRAHESNPRPLRCHAALTDRIDAPAIGRSFADLVTRRLRAD